MGELMIRCQKTGKPVPTGIYLDQRKFRSMPVFFSSSYCVCCGGSHEWFARDAWMGEPDSDAVEMPRRRQLA